MYGIDDRPRVTWSDLRALFWLIAFALVFVAWTAVDW